MIIHLSSAKHIDAGRFELAFSDGRHGVVDLTGELNGPVFEPLRDPEFMARGALDAEARTLAWPNGADVAPEYLYFLAFRDDRGLSMLFHEWGYLRQESLASR
ncbi:MAG TPA: DUF2442 domain-containing protein [Thermoanaerobaculia bacterium]|jgi:hypothetical protein|nr:DUF2442 domain-containing protein [Thermoanaerobaculia bacterium]